MGSFVRIYPLIPLRGVLVFPYTVSHLDVGREKSIYAIEKAMLGDKIIFLAAQKIAQNDSPLNEDIFSIGTVAEIKQILKLPGGVLRILVEGLARGKIIRHYSQDEFLSVEVEQYTEEPIKTPEVEALRRNLIYQFEQYVKLSRRVPAETLSTVTNLKEPGHLADIIASHLNLRVEDKQRLLEAVEIVSRLELLGAIVAKELEIVELERKINLRVRKQVEKTQKEYYLREQMKAIQHELGEKDGGMTEGEEYRKKITAANLPKEVEEKVLKEVERLEKMPPMAAELAVIRTYLDWLLALPWNKSTEDRLDIKAAQAILEEDHYGLKPVKERILEYLAIQKLSEKKKGPILCFIGPPGVGKTSLGRSIARAIERNFVRISLGGIRDEAEIRGHRRTYVGALPGRIIQGMRNAGSKNPVFLLDEVDKMSMDFRGDPSSALLEVLDPEQNNNFSDHYIEVPFDLSNVMFITTANVQYSIPRPLLDRMEIIYLSGYTEEEKTQIALRHLLPKQLKEHGLTSEVLRISENSIRKVIREHTRESGVRNLERELAALCRKSAKQIVVKEAKKIRVTVQNLERFLGSPRFRYGTAEQSDQIGVAMGLAWTEVGGDILAIEVTLYQGNGKLTLTGKLGDVMKESAQAGYSYVRTLAGNFGIEDGYFDRHDIHVHIPEGAIPKDGPSAGITMACALVSALTQRKVRCDVAMTGEITLRGRVLPVGGIKEKVLAAHRAGIKTVVLPKDNQKDLEDIPANVKNKLKFILVENMDEVLAQALLAKEFEPKPVILGALPHVVLDTSYQPSLPDIQCRSDFQLH